MLHRFPTTQVLFGFMIIAGGCGHKKPPSQANTVPPARLAAPALEDSIEVSPAQGAQLTFQKTALGKAFLLSPSFTEAGNMPILQHLQPKVVSFELSGDRLALFELNVQAVYNEMPSSKLMQTFQVVREDATSVTFTWNYGLSAIPLNNPTPVSDEDASGAAAVESTQTVLPVTESFVRKATIENNVLEIEQVARVNQSELSLDLVSVLSGQPLALAQREATVVLDVRIEPYVPNTNFDMRQSDPNKRVGFFEIARNLTASGEVAWFSTRWDLTKGPVTYAITENTPPQLVTAISEGILYWNRVAGQEIVRVETNAKTNEKPQPHRVLVRWIPWTRAGFARASIQTDPLTGEIITGDIYLTSSFDVSARKYTTGAIKNLPTEKRKKKVTPGQAVPQKATLGLSGFSNANICDLDTSETSLAPEIFRAQKDDQDRAIVNRAVQDYMRATVAHEVGHTLGLRHNFAASMNSELTTSQDHAESFEAYLRGDTKGASVGSSVMDYFMPQDDFLLGAALKTVALPYDRKALQWGYSKEEVDSTSLDMPLFCTDTEATTTLTYGCGIFDSGRNPFAGYAYEVLGHRNAMASRIATTLLDGRDDIVSAIASLDPSKLASTVNAPTEKAFALLSSEAKPLSVKREGPIAWFNKDDMTAKNQKAMADAFTEVKGLPGWMSIAYGIDDSGLVLKGELRRLVEARLNEDTSLQNAEQRTALLEMAGVIADKVETAILLKGIKVLTGESEKEAGASSLGTLLSGKTEESSHIQSRLNQESWKPQLARIAEYLILSSDGARSTKAHDATVLLPLPKFNKEIRIAAARLYKKECFGAEDEWMNDEAARSIQTMENRLTLLAEKPLSAIFKIPGVTPEPKNTTLKLSVLPENREWTETEFAVLKALVETQGEIE